MTYPKLPKKAARKIMRDMQEIKAAADLERRIQQAFKDGDDNGYMRGLRDGRSEVIREKSAELNKLQMRINELTRFQEVTVSMARAVHDIASFRR